MPKNSGNFYSRVVLNQESSSDFWNRMKSKWNGGHHLLPTTDSPAISACTTSTNLSGLDFQSTSTIHKFKTANLEENLRRAIPELEPLHLDTKVEMGRQDSFGDSLCPSKGEKRQIFNQRGEATIMKVLVRADTHVTFTVPETEPKAKCTLSQVIAALAVSWVSMIIGYVSGYTSPAGKSLNEDFHMSKIEFSWISGIMPLAGLFGGLLGGPLIEIIGRKWTILTTNALFLIGWSINYFAQETWYLHLSRLVCGTGVGIASLALPVYLGETIQPEVRGTLGLFPTALGNIGILICFLMGIPCRWQTIAGLGALLSIPFFFVIWFIPETPRWYVAKSRNEEARKALHWLRGKANTETVKTELQDLVASHESSRQKTQKLKDLFTTTNLRSLGIVLGLMFFQQFSGINAVIFYTTQIFDDAGSKIDSSIQTVIVGCVNFIATFIATALVDRLGRKLLLYISSVTMIITLAILGTYFYFLHVLQKDMSSVAWLPLASCMIYVLGFSFGFGPVPWLMMGEILPAKIRGPAASISTGFNWTCTFIVTTAFPIFVPAFGTYTAFWLFGIIVIGSLVFTILFVPETRGQSLEDIERSLAGVKVRRMSSAANLKPLPSSF